MMTLKRKICRDGTGVAFFLPKSWLALLEEKHGKIEALTTEVNGSLIMKPITNKSKNIREGEVT